MGMMIDIVGAMNGIVRVITVIVRVMILTGSGVLHGSFICCMLTVSLFLHVNFSEAAFQIGTMIIKLTEVRV